MLTGDGSAAAFTPGVSAFAPTGAHAETNMVVMAAAGADHRRIVRSGGTATERRCRPCCASRSSAPSGWHRDPSCRDTESGLRPRSARRLPASEQDAEPSTIEKRRRARSDTGRCWLNRLNLDIDVVPIALREYRVRLGGNQVAGVDLARIVAVNVRPDAIAGAIIDLGNRE